MLLTALLCSLLLSAVGQQQMDDGWLDPYDMLNYDPGAKSMRRPSEPTSYTNVDTKRREYTQESNQAEFTSCSQQVSDLQKEIEDQKKTITLVSQQPTCSPVFKRFLSRLLKEIQRVGVPTDSTDVFYDATVKLSKQTMAEIQSLLEGEDRWRTGALDNAVSQILVDFKPHDYEAWRWRFEDTFGVEIDTVLKVAVFFMIISTLICTQLWSTVSWFVQFKRMFCVCFFVSIAWNWLYLYQTAFAEHQKNIVKMENFDKKCTGVKKMDWSDSLKEWYRTTWTLQDDPCEEYYKVLLINPLLLVPPTKAITVTITTFITDPLKHLGQGISEFLRALLKDLPVTLQIPVFITIVLAIVVVFYGSVQAAFQHGIMAPLRRPRRDPPHPELQHPQRIPLRIEDHNYSAGGDAPAPASAPAPVPAQQQVPRHIAEDTRLDRNSVHQRRPNRVAEKPAPVTVETLRSADRHYSEDETDAHRLEGGPAAEENPPLESDSENQQEIQEEVQREGAAAKATHPETKPAETGLSQMKNKPPKKENEPPDEPSRDAAAARRPSAERPLSHTAAQDPGASAEEASSESLRSIETVGVPVQETRQI
uniref:Chloride channel CLIC-like protein 1 n=1 Tax=Iconisemion striatum TaxID=60296 RepID=A0A1A7YTY2_9TELE